MSIGNYRITISVLATVVLFLLVNATGIVPFLIVAVLFWWLGITGSSGVRRRLRDIVESVHGFLDRVL